MEKVCTKCNEPKDLMFFTKNINNKDGLEYWCKDCRKEYNKSFLTREHVDQKSKVCTSCKCLKAPSEFGKCTKCNDGLKSKCKDCRKKDEYLLNRDKILFNKKGKKQNPPTSEKRREYKRNHFLKHRDSINKYRRVYSKKRRKNDNLFKLSGDIRTLIGTSFKKYVSNTDVKSRTTESILGCTMLEFIEHIVSLFTEGMTLENHGNCEECWHIDHKIPISSAINEEHFYKLNHYTNLQPLWSRDNMSKGSKIT